MRRVAAVVGTTLLLSTPVLASLSTPVLAQNAGSTGYGGTSGLDSTSILSSAPALSSVSATEGQQGSNPITAGVLPDGRDAASPSGLPNGTVQMLLSPPPASDDDN